MRWFRSHSLKVASLALFALGQFALASGHVHLDHFAGRSSNWAIAAAAGKAAAAPGGNADLPASPRQKDPSGLGDEFCSNMSLAGALVVPNTPTLLAGLSFFKEFHWSFAAAQARIGLEPSVWAECLFVDPIADIAVLGSPDTQKLGKQADTYQALVVSARPLSISDAPEEGPALLFSLTGEQMSCGTSVARYASPTPSRASCRVCRDRR